MSIRNISLASISKLYIEILHSEDNDEYVYLPFEALVRRWSAGFPLDKLENFIDECVVTKSRIIDSIYNGDTGERVRGYVVSTTKTGINIQFGDLESNVIYGIKYGNSRIYLVYLGYSKETLYSMIDLTAINVQIKETPAYALKLSQKLSLIGQNYEIKTDGYNTIVIIDNIKEYMGLISKMPCRIADIVSLGDISVICKVVALNKELHFVNLMECRIGRKEKVRTVKLPPDIWRLNIGNEYGSGINFHEAERVVVELSENATIEYIADFNICWLCRESIKLAKCVRRISGGNIFIHNRLELMTEKLELNFEKLVYVGYKAINLGNPVIYNLGDRDIVFSTDSIFMRSTKNAYGIFKVGNKNTLIQLIQAINEAYKSGPGTVLIVVGSEVSLRGMNIKQAGIKIIREKQYNSYKWTQLSGVKFWEAYEQNIKLL